MLACERIPRARLGNRAAASAADAVAAATVTVAAALRATRIHVLPTRSTYLPIHRHPPKAGMDSEGAGEQGGKRRRKQNSKYSDDALGSVLGGGIDDFPAPSPRENAGSGGGSKPKPKPKTASRTPSGGSKAKLSRPRSGSGGGSSKKMARSPSGGGGNSEKSEAEAHEERVRQDPMSPENLATTILELLQTHGPLTFDEIADEVLVDMGGSASPVSSPRGGGGGGSGNLAAHLHKKQLALLKQVRCLPTPFSPSRRPPKLFNNTGQRDALHPASSYHPGANHKLPLCCQAILPPYVPPCHPATLPPYHLPSQPTKAITPPPHFPPHTPRFWIC